MEKLIRIQGELKAPKNQYNQFGKYKYRSCEDILEAVKPLLISEGLLMNISDMMVEVGGRVYCKASVTIIDDAQTVQSCGWAREAETQKGMADAQISGSASSYARKYALNAMFLIDDTKDDDFINKHGKDEKSSYKASTPIKTDDPFKDDLEALRAKAGDSVNNSEYADGKKKALLGAIPNADKVFLENIISGNV